MVRACLFDLDNCLCAADAPGPDFLRPLFEAIAGDNPDSELAAGARIGIRTVQILRPGVVRSIAADHHINELAELQALLR